jgi:hypothetical protein
MACANAVRILFPTLEKSQCERKSADSMANAPWPSPEKSQKSHKSRFFLPNLCRKEFIDFVIDTLHWLIVVHCIFSWRTLRRKPKLQWQLMNFENKTTWYFQLVKSIRKLLRRFSLIIQSAKQRRRLNVFLEGSGGETGVIAPIRGLLRARLIVYKL